MNPRRWKVVLTAVLLVGSSCEGGRPYHPQDAGTADAMAADMGLDGSLEGGRGGSTAGSGGTVATGGTGLTGTGMGGVGSTGTGGLTGSGGTAGTNGGEGGLAIGGSSPTESGGKIGAGGQTGAPSGGSVGIGSGGRGGEGTGGGAGILGSEGGRGAGGTAGAGNGGHGGTPGTGGIACLNPMTTCSASCVDTLTDKGNCGACGHDCLGGMCSDGHCAPKLVASGFSGSDLALSATDVYVVDGNSGGRLLKIAKTDGTITPIAGGGVTGVAIYGTTVYWTAWITSGTEGVVSRSALDGSGRVDFATGQANPGPIVVDASGTYWINLGVSSATGSVMRRGPNDAGAVPVAESLPGPCSIALDGTNVYWMTTGIDAGRDGAIYRKAKSGSGSVATVAPMQPNASGSLFSLAVVQGTLFWAPRGLGNTDGLVRSMPIGGGSIAEIARDQVRPQSVAADDAFVYWVSEGGTNDGLVQKASLTTHTITQIAGALPNPMDIAIDGPALYFTTAGTDTKAGGLYRLAR